MTEYELYDDYLNYKEECIKNGEKPIAWYKFWKEGLKPEVLKDEKEHGIRFKERSEKG